MWVNSSRVTVPPAPPDVDNYGFRPAPDVPSSTAPDVSRLRRGQFREYSIERLLRLLTALGGDVDIVISRPKWRRRGRLAVDAA
jgi:hypothetical protein